MKNFLLGFCLGALLSYLGTQAIQNGESFTSLPVPLVEWAQSLHDSIQELTDRLPHSHTEQQVSLVQVIDGDTIDVRINGVRERIRYIGANTPEQDEPCFAEATRANIRLLRSGPLSLDTDRTDRDRFGRLLRYVYAGDVLVERALIAEGWAEVVKYRSDDKHYEEFRRLEIAAAEQGLGCHPTGIFDDGSYER